MARAWRIEYAGACYHVLARGNEQRPIFNDEVDRELFLQALGQMSDRFEIDLYAYVLMGNHYHLLLRSRQANLSRSLQWLGGVYSGTFNRRHQRSGHLFQGRFKSFLVESDTYLLTLSCYIHRNPLRARLVERLVDYRWSSYPAYAYGRNRAEWLKEDLILSQLPGRDKRKAYREKVQQYAREEQSAWEDLRHGLFYGSQRFVDRMKQAYGSQAADPEKPQQKALRKEGLLAEMVQRVAAALGGEAEALLQIRRGQRNEGRDLLIYYLWSTGLYRNGQIGQLLKIGASGVSQRIQQVKRHMEQEKQLKHRFHQLTVQMKI